MKSEKIENVLEKIYKRASKLPSSVVKNRNIRERVDYVCRCISNRAGVRLLMSCLLGKIKNPKVDPRKPYTEIGTDDCFSGRTLDEHYLTPFINKYRLPCNPTTAFLTPTLRNNNTPLTTDHELVGRPRELYIKTIQLLDDVAKKRIPADTLLIDTVRVLLILRNEKLARIKSLINSLGKSEGALPLSVEAIVMLISQHIVCKNSSRLPVLIVAAAYQAAGERLGEQVMPLYSHNAADLQTGSLGDVEIHLKNDDSLVTAYEMKMKKVTLEDIDAAVAKIARGKQKIDSYIFITTDVITEEVTEYAAKFYEETGGTEIVVLDCIGFLRHFLHLFHRLRMDFLNTYQKLVLKEADSAVSQNLKEAFLALRQAAESDE